MTTRLILLALTAVSLCACGRRGDLEQPPPLWGERAKAQYEAEQRARTQREEPDAPRANQRPADSATANTTATRAPVEGTNDPVGARTNLDPNTPSTGSGGGKPR